MQEMAALAGEADSFGIYAMPVPPLLFDEDGASKVIACAELGIPLIWAPAPNAGTTAPASIAAVIVVANAEVLAGLVLSQAVKPGAPFVWGVGVGAMNMRTMNEVYSSADVFRGHQAQTDLARWYDLPSFAYAAHTDSKMLDEQWSAEAALTAILGKLSRATLLHDVGYLECGLQSSYESIVLRRPPHRLGQGVHGAAAPWTTRRWRWTRSRRWGRAATTWPGPTRASTSGRSGRATCFDTTRHDAWEADGSKTLLDRLRARVAELRSEPRAFELQRRRKAGLDRILADVEAHRPGT